VRARHVEGKGARYFRCLAESWYRDAADSRFGRCGSSTTVARGQPYPALISNSYHNSTGTGYSSDWPRTATLSTSYSPCTRIGHLGNYGKLRESGTLSLERFPLSGYRVIATQSLSNGPFSIVLRICVVQTVGLHLPWEGYTLLRLRSLRYPSSPTMYLVKWKQHKKRSPLSIFFSTRPFQGW
jgi:hypothetical protein